MITFLSKERCFHLQSIWSMTILFQTSPNPEETDKNNCHFWIQPDVTTSSVPSPHAQKSKIGHSQTLVTHPLSVLFRSLLPAPPPPQSSPQATGDARPSRPITDVVTHSSTMTTIHSIKLLLRSFDTLVTGACGTETVYRSYFYMFCYLT